ncbi:hypothetical protein TB2_030532 [Malus domestica]
MDWDIDSKLSALTFDDCSTNDDIVVRIKDRISQNRPLLVHGRLFDIRSAAHLLNSVVQDVLEAMREVIQNIRGNFKHVRSSQMTQGKFNEIVQQVGINVSSVRNSHGIQGCIFSPARA